MTKVTKNTVKNTAKKATISKAIETKKVPVKRAKRITPVHNKIITPLVTDLNPRGDNRWIALLPVLGFLIILLAVPLYIANKDTVKGIFNFDYQETEIRIPGTGLTEIKPYDPPKPSYSPPKSVEVAKPAPNTVPMVNTPSTGVGK